MDGGKIIERQGGQTGLGRDVGGGGGVGVCDDRQDESVAAVLCIPISAASRWPPLHPNTHIHMHVQTQRHTHTQMKLRRQSCCPARSGVQFESALF